MREQGGAEHFCNATGWACAQESPKACGQLQACSAVGSYALKDLNWQKRVVLVLC